MTGPAKTADDCRLAAANLRELILMALPDGLERALALAAADECRLWIDEADERKDGR